VKISRGSVRACMRVLIVSSGCPTMDREAPATKPATHGRQSPVAGTACPLGVLGMCRCRSPRLAGSEPPIPPAGPRPPAAAAQR
jgi:hypothetical protein